METKSAIVRDRGNKRLSEFFGGPSAADSGKEDGAKPSQGQQMSLKDILAELDEPEVPSAEESKPEEETKARLTTHKQTDLRAFAGKKSPMKVR